VEQARLTLFGSPRVEREGERVDFDTRKATALLAYLAVTDRPHRRDSLASMLWPESDEVRARSSLRRTLSVAAVVGPALQAGRDELTLSSAAISCDVTEFGQLVGQEDLSSRRAAIDLASDDFMAGFSLRDSPAFDDWQASTAERLRDQVVASLAILVDEDVTRGHHDSALVLTRRWLAADPMSELAHRQLMRLLTWIGQRPLALQQYRKLVRILDRELGVEPLPETIALYDDIRGDRLTRPDVRSEVGSRSHVITPKILQASAPSSHEPTIVGRDQERQRLLESWRGSAGTGELAGLVGEPGLGRTALALDLANEVMRLGGRTALVRVHEGEHGLALAAAGDMARNLVRLLSAEHRLSVDVISELARLDPSLTRSGEGTAPLDTPGALLRFFDAVGQLVEQSLVGQPPGLLVIDDAHWLDPSSADLIAYVVRRLPAGLMVLVTWRPDVGSTGLTNLVLDKGELVILKPLRHDAVATLIAVEGAGYLMIDDVYRRTAGVPRLVHEHLAAARAGTDSSGPMRDVVLARLESASPTARQLTSAAAVLGGVVDPELLRATAGRAELESVDAIEEAVTRGLLVEVAERRGYDFPHDLLRGIVLERTGLARQRLLHGRAADILMRRHAVDKKVWPAAVVADHLAAAGQREAAASWYWRAAGEARDLYAHREELEQLSAAQAAGYEAAEVHAAVAAALTRLGSYRQALVSYEQAAATTDDAVELAVLEHRLATVHDRLGEWRIAQAHLESADALLDGKETCALRARVTADLAFVMHRQGVGQAATVKAEMALGLADSSGDVRALAQAHNVLGVLAIGRGEFALAVEHLEQSMTWAVQLSDVGAAVAAANNLARAQELAGNPDQALSAAEEALDLGLTHGDRHRVAALHSNLADMMHQRGRELEAQLHAKKAAEAFADVDDAGLQPRVWTLVEW